jgi:hypothetical protein
MKNQVKILMITIELVNFYSIENKSIERFVCILETILRDGSYPREQIIDSLSTRKYDDVMAFYLLLGLRPIEVIEILI